MDTANLPGKAIDKKSVFALSPVLGAARVKRGSLDENESPGRGT